MSFTSQLKTQLAKKPVKSSCLDAQLNAMLLIDGSIHILDRKVTITAITENASVAKMFKQSLEEKELEAHLKIKRSNLQNHSSYTVNCRGGYLDEVLTKIGVTDEKGSPKLKGFIEDYNLCCQKTFLRGLFLSGGYISSPGSGYRLQLIMNNYNLAKETATFLKKHGFKSSLGETKKNYHVNIGNRNGVLKFLAWIGASDVLLDFENVQIIKDLKNYANRLVNSDTANMRKTAIASMDQIKIIDFLQRKVGFKNLPPALSEIAYLRMNYPSSSIENLGRKSAPPLSKSAVNHRLRRLKKIASQLGY